jgi:Zn-dependent protease
LLSSLCVHEWAHAWTAEKLGDSTPRSLGRVTLNPAAHIDPVGTVVFPLACIFLIPGGFLFGWAKPVPFNPQAFKHPGRGSVLVAMAGPFSNAVIALVAAIIGHQLYAFNSDTLDIFGWVVYLNVILMTFNLLPIPPLDGSHLMRHLSGMRDETYFQISRWGGLALLAIIMIPPLRKLLHNLIQLALIPFYIVYPELKFL